MGKGINTYRIRFLWGTSLYTAYIQGENQEKAIAEFLTIFKDIQAERIVSVIDINEKKEPTFEYIKLIKTFTPAIILLLVGIGLYFGWNSYNKMLKRSKAKYTYPSYTKQQTIKNSNSKTSSNNISSKNSITDKNLRKKNTSQATLNQQQTLDQMSASQTLTQRESPEIYYARIGQRDHYNSRSHQRLSGAGNILQQDRANYHKYHRVDREDTGDSYFNTREHRNKIASMLARGSTTQETLNAIEYGTPLVKVAIYQNHIDVSLVSGGSQSRQKQHRNVRAQRTTVPVMVGGEPDLDACGGAGVIRGISSHGDGFVAVRSGPGTKYKLIDKIYHNGVSVAMCDAHRKWEGIVYGGSNCGTGSPIANKQPYSGPCKVGWVFGKYVKLVAD